MSNVYLFRAVISNHFSVPRNFKSYYKFFLNLFLCVPPNFEKRLRITIEEDTGMSFLLDSLYGEYEFRTMVKTINSPAQDY